MLIDKKKILPGCTAYYKTNDTDVIRKDIIVGAPEYYSGHNHYHVTCESVVLDLTWIVRVEGGKLLNIKKKLCQ